MFEKVQEIMANSLGVSPETITPASSFETLKLDSLDFVEIIMDLEAEFSIAFPEDLDLRTVADLVAYISENAA